MTTPYRFDSTETGAPVLNNAAGSGVALLLACLKNGFNVKAITSIAVASNVATVTCPTHGYACGPAQYVKITGASAPALDGDKQPTLVDANTFTYPAPGVADGAYTATDARRAPLGWDEEFNNGLGTRSIFKRTAPEATAQKLWVDDLGTVATDMRAKCVETATGVDTYTGESPSLSGGYYWFKGANTAAAKRWKLVGDGLGFYLFVDLSGSGHYRYFPFGDLVSFKAGDAYHTMIGGELVQNSGAGNLGWLAPVNPGSIPANELLTLARRNSQLGAVAKAGAHLLGASLPGSSGPTFPSPVDSGCVVLTPVLINEDVVASGHPIRGYAPGLAQAVSVRPFADNQVVENVTGTAHKFLAVPLISSSSGQILVDLTTWR